MSSAVPLSSTHSITFSKLCFCTQLLPHFSLFVCYVITDRNVIIVVIFITLLTRSLHSSTVWDPQFASMGCFYSEKKQSQRLLPGQRLMKAHFSLPAGIAHSPVARRVKETQFIADKSQGDNVLWFNQRWTDYCWQGKHNQRGIGLLILLKTRGFAWGANP